MEQPTEKTILEPKRVFQGQTHGHEGFLLEKSIALKTLKAHPEYSEILKPFLIGDELVAEVGSQPSRFVIDFTMMDVNKAATYKEPFQRIEMMVLPDRKEKGKKQKEENEEVLKANPKAKVNKHHINFLNKWWKLSYGREDMLRQLNLLKRYVACARVTQRPIFEFYSSGIRPNDKVMAFMFDDYYTFGLIQSNIHWLWFLEKCTTLAETPNYNSAAIWDTFPWPQKPSQKQIEKVAEAAMKLHQVRSKVLKENKMSLRDLYRLLEQPGNNPVKDLHEKLDAAVIECYGFDPKQDLLIQLLELNLSVAAQEEQGETVQPPGWPESALNKEKYVTDDCVSFEE